MAHARAMKILVPTLRFVARASRRPASTIVSTFFSAVTAIRLEVQREIHALPPISTERPWADGPRASHENGLCLWGSQFWRQPPIRGGLTLVGCIFDGGL